MIAITRLSRLLAAAFAIGAAALLPLAPAWAKPPLEAFGDVPEVRAMDISPDGKRLGYINRLNGTDYLFVYDLETKVAKPLVSVADIKARTVQFVGNNYIVLVASKTGSIFGFRGRHEFSAAFAYNLTTSKVVRLLNRTDNLYPGQSSLGRIVGIDPGGKHVFMPAWIGAVGASEPDNNLLRVSLETGRGESSGYRGNSNTRDWLVDNQGAVIAREDFSEKRKLHEVRALGGGSGRTIYTKETVLPDVSITGVSSDGKSLIAVADQDSDFLSLFEMSLADGSMKGPVFQRTDAEIDGLIMDQNRRVFGVRYSGMRPDYEFFDKTVQTDIRVAQNTFANSSVWLTGWSEDWSKLLLFVEGGKETERYALFDRATKKLLIVTRGRSLVAPEDIGEVITIEYKADDGLKIPGLITWPVGVAADQRKNLPLVVLPHGGPEAYDSISYDWLAQFVANEGYAVLQPNFRGSAGFGSAFRDAGRGEWGRKMQNDITDGVEAMITMGWADPNRICIMGWSYGGYAALAGGALTPDKYKCVISVAGVSNLREMIAYESGRYGPRSMTVTYWKSLIGDPSKDAKEIDAVSPAKLAAKFAAPVLLIHGTDDTTVPAKQSDLMNDALKGAQKPVEYVKIKGDDHGLVDNDSRRTTLTKIAEFLKTHIGPK
jgi:dipeptidyl aminopeptidase/acylaminoacyl peptidase